MCVAAMTLDDKPRWVRLHPVPFRDLGDDSKFRKYQEVTTTVIRPRSDRRPESWTPLDGTIQLGETVGTDHGWSTRRERVAKLGEHTMCELIKANQSGSGPSIPSLAVVRTAGPPELLVDQRDEEQLDKWQKRADAIAAQPSLFDDPTTAKPAYKIIPWRFRYKYRCLASSCRGEHRQTIIDWEAVALYRNVHNKVNWQDLMRQKFVDQLWTNRDTVLFVGNMNEHPQSFLVLGLFWPPRTDMQQSLLA